MTTIISAFVVDRVEYSLDGTPTVYITEETNDARIKQSRNSGSPSDSGRDAQRIGERDASGGNQSEVQPVREEIKSDVQPLSERNSKGYTDEQTELRGVRGEVTANRFCVSHD